jgi:hypothetical protein
MKGVGYCGDFCSHKCAEDPTTPHYTVGTHIVVKTQMCYITCYELQRTEYSPEENCRSKSFAHHGNILTITTNKLLYWQWPHTILLVWWPYSSAPGHKSKQLHVLASRLQSHWWKPYTTRIWDVHVYRGSQFHILEQYSFYTKLFSSEKPHHNWVKNTTSDRSAKSPSTGLMSLVVYTEQD